jgi:hypothetical protein
MFNDLDFSIIKNRKPKTKNSKTSNKNTKQDWMFMKESLKKGDFHVLWMSSFFERMLEKIQKKFIFCKIRFLWNNLGKIQLVACWVFYKKLQVLLGSKVELRPNFKYEIVNSEYEIVNSE